MFLSRMFGYRAGTFGNQLWCIKRMKKTETIKKKKQKLQHPNGTETKTSPQCLRYILFVFAGFSLSFCALYATHTDGPLRYCVT